MQNYTLIAIGVCNPSLEIDYAYYYRESHRTDIVEISRLLVEQVTSFEAAKHLVKNGDLWSIGFSDTGFESISYYGRGLVDNKTTSMRTAHDINEFMKNTNHAIIRFYRSITGQWLAYDYKTSPSNPNISGIEKTKLDPKTILEFINTRNTSSLFLLER